MKRIIQSTILLLLFTISFWSCVSDENEEPGGSGIAFSLQVERYEESPSDGKAQSTRADGSQITELVTAVYNSEGMLQRNVSTETSADNSFVSVEGLRDGTYKVAFMGVGKRFSEESIAITAPANISDNWLEHSGENTPCLDEYFYAETDIAVTGGTIATRPSITMRRIVGLVEIAPIIANDQFPSGSIKKITVSFDAGMLYSGHSPQGGYTGSTQFSDYTVNTSRQFYTLPSLREARVKGSVTVVGERYNGVVYTQEYPFEVAVERNKKTIIRPHYDMVGDQYGMIRLYDAERNASNSQLFFQDGQSYRSIFTRSFYPSNPLFVSFDKERKNAIISHYSSVAVSDVTILAKRKNDKEYFELAWVESMRPFEERTIGLPANRIYRTESGGAVEVANIGEDRLYYKYRSENKVLQKINKITWPIKIQFVQSKDTVNFNVKTLPVRPVHAREAVELFTNMGYVLSNGWKEAMLESEAKKPMTDNGRVVSLTNEVFPKIWQPASNIDHLVFSIVNHLIDPYLFGVAYVGDGGYYSLQQCVVFNFERGGDFSRMTNYHEYGHVLGYGHDGSFTYNEMSSVSYSVHSRLYKAGETPYTENILHPELNPNRYEIVNGVMK